METNIIGQMSETRGNSRICWKTLTDCYVNTLWKHILDAHGELYRRTDINIPEEILMEQIFFNTRFKIENEVFHFGGLDRELFLDFNVLSTALGHFRIKDWMVKDFFFVKDLVKDEGVFLNFNEFHFSGKASC